MSRIVPNSMPAERERGCRFAETFRSEADVIRNNGEVFGAPTFDENGIVLNGTSQYVRFNLAETEFRGDKISMVVEFWPDFGTDEDVQRHIFATTSDDFACFKRNNAASNVLRIRFRDASVDIAESTYSPFWMVGQRNVLVAAGVSGNNNVWLNGNVLVENEGTPWGPGTTLTELFAGSRSAVESFFAGKIGGLKFFKSQLERQEAFDLYNETTYDYPNRALVYLPMQAAQDDTENLSGVELLVDGDMEAADTSAWTAGNNATLTKDTTDPYEGARCLRVAYNGASNPYARQDVFTAGGLFRVTGYARSDGTALPRVSDGGLNNWTGSDSTSWQPFDISITAQFNQFRLYAMTTSAGYCEFDDVSVEQIIPRTLDVSGNGNHAILGDGATPSTYPTKLTKRGYSFDGGDYARILDSQSGGHDFTTVNQCTFFILARATGDFSGDGSLWRAVMTVAELRSEGGGGTRKVVFNIGFDQSRCSIGRGLDKLLSNYQPAQGQVVSVTGVYDGANLSIYVNGELDNSTASTGDESVGTGAANYFVGSRTLDSGDPGSYLTGNLLAHACWGYALTPMQVADLHINMVKSINRV